MSLTKREHVGDTASLKIPNHKNGDIVNHSLVLLEGEIGPVDHISMESPKETSNWHCDVINKDNVVSDSDTTRCKADNQIKLSSSKEMQILVHHEGSCQPWPVVDGKFKLFVRLQKGVNNLELDYPPLQSQLPMSLTYAPIENQPRFVRVVYIKCSDSEGTFDSPDDSDNDLNMAKRKLCFNALLLQTFVAVDMHKHGFGFQTFRLEEDEDGEVLVHVFVSKLTTEEAHQMNGGQLYSWFHSEQASVIPQTNSINSTEDSTIYLVQQGDFGYQNTKRKPNSELTSSTLSDPKCKFLVFMSCTHYMPPDEIDVKQITKYVKAHTALGGGQLGLFGTAGLHTWAKDVDELVKCFTDNREIDRRKLFDDSAGRGTFWANYSTTLGAALHELGHCFDLAHTPEGIMARGFDDMNHFATVTRPDSRCVPSIGPTSVGDDLTSRKIFADHKAHWYRSSAVLLHYHKWFRPCTELASTEEENERHPQVSWSSHVKGPVGNGGGGQKNQSYFDDEEWCNTNGFVFSGYVVYHSDYVNALQPLTISTKESGADNPVHGKVDDKCSVHVFPLEEGEYLASIEVRAGAWIDAIRFHTNMKSSIWFGGRGGNWYQMEPSSQGRITGIFGTFGDFIGSVGVRFQHRTSLAEPHCATDLQIHSHHGIRLIEVRKKDELTKFWEFVDEDPPKTFHFPFPWWKIQEDMDDCSIFVEDSEGSTCESGLLGFKEFIKGRRDPDITNKRIASFE